MDKVKGGVEYTAAKLKEKIDKGAEKLGLDTDSPEVLESRTKVCMARGLGPIHSVAKRLELAEPKLGVRIRKMYVKS
jgi:hypothetical protein